MRHGLRVPHSPAGFPGQTGHSLSGISHKSSQGFSIFMWLIACGNPSDYAPGGPALSFWTRWLDVESWEPEGTHATSHAEMWEGSARGQANPCSGPEMHGGRKVCLVRAGDAQTGLKRVPKAKLDELLSAL